MRQMCVTKAILHRRKSAQISIPWFLITDIVDDTVNNQYVCVVVILTLEIRLK